ncbi:MAG: rhomboid family intramembrane serine protease [Nannocystaceae bacterium]|nr:rhomboid family intramembrane serine protease [Nannocystaceae bacterium]
MFPYRDDNPTLRTPVVTIALIAVNVLIWVLLQGAGTEPALTASICEHGAIPANLTGALRHEVAVELAPQVTCIVGPHADWLTVPSSMFMHGGWMHLLGNMWFLWLFGNNVEDSMGRVRFVGFYLLCGLAACAAQVLANGHSLVPMVGASGAIGGVMGAYIVLYPRVRVHMLVVLVVFVFTVTVPAYFMLGYWILLQVLGALPQWSSDAAGVAYWAHIGGFAAGALLIRLFANPELVEAHRRAWAYEVAGGE